MAAVHEQKRRLQQSTGEDLSWSLRPFDNAKLVLHAAFDACSSACVRGPCC